MGYLSAVRRYLTRPKLRQYAFSTVAWKSMQRGMTPKRVRRLLKELYRVYFQLYPNEV